MKARVVDPDSRQPLPRGQTGILELQGPNIFPGYLEDPQRTAATFHEGWYSTGDMATVSDDGFLTISGRLSRFSKIGGEMVPHLVIEDHLREAFGWTHEPEPVIAVAGVADEKRGESLVLLSTRELTPQIVRERLIEQGLPNLWIPRLIRRIETIPVLPTGKFDLAAIRKLAAR
jgi:acyl-[acyl-carrier-protein]-phospholipid O-acyltransferase/long-chain-fatty-acid--[acyl-carrier-protein] ligase